jgi:DNA-directed RNA polymerase subunit beta'
MRCTRKTGCRSGATRARTGGPPRVVELFEARKPRETAIISEIDAS